MTFDQFSEVMRKGTDLDNAEISPLLQVMPWPVCGNMTDHDLRAVYEFLSAILLREPGTCSGPGE